MGRLTIFAKGNLDVRDTLHSLRLGGETAWNGVNEVLRARTPPILARVRHETWSRSDVLLQGLDRPPADLAERGLPLGPLSLESQFSQAVFETDADAIVLSIQPDVGMDLARRRGDGVLFHPHDAGDWPAADQAWLRETCDRVGLIEPDASMANFERIIDRLRRRADVPILIYNLSSVVPGEQVHAHDGLGDIVSTRIRRFNLALIELSQATGVSIVDVDAIVARAGADRLKYDSTHLTGEGCRAVAQEVARVLDDLGVLTAEAVGA